jgi:cytochrome oxidase Cu insertion factor (SCO1/SenC/PrrC family)
LPVRRPPGPLAAVLGCLIALACSRPADPDAARPAAAPAATEAPEGLEFAPPAAGTYSLPPIQEAVDGVVVGTDGSRRRLFDYLGDRHVVLSFIYTRCVDSEGCPLATGILGMIREELEAAPELAAEVRLISLSFDPARDTTEVMRRYASHAVGPEDVSGGPIGGAGSPAGHARGRDARSWVFLTTPSAADLQPILDGYGQSIVPEVDERGRPTGDFSHVLKVYLIDRRRRVRNIYSTAFLHPAIALNDLRTLVMEEAGRAGGRS